MVSQRNFTQTLFDSGSTCTLRQGDTFRHVHNLPPFSMNWTTLKNSIRTETTNFRIQIEKFYREQESYRATSHLEAKIRTKES